MTRRPTAKAPVPAQLNAQQMRAGIERVRLRIADLEALDVQSLSTGHENVLQSLEAAIEEALARTFGSDTADYERYQAAANLQLYESMFMVTGYEVPKPSLGEVRAEIEEKRLRSLSLLNQVVRGLDEELAHAAPSSLPSVKSSPTPNSRKVFVVHGHDEAALHGLARFLEHLALEAIILREQPDQGRTIIEKFEDAAGGVGFAVVLLTPDDWRSPDEQRGGEPRARQNVVFELGYFAGKLGRGKVCLLRKGAVEIPSDLYGVIYTDLDPGEGWKLKLGRELKAAGYEVDLNQCI